MCVQNTFLERFALPGVSGLEEYNRYMEQLRNELEYQFQVCVCLSVGGWVSVMNQHVSHWPFAVTRLLYLHVLLSHLVLSSQLL